jgi:hypothetical protein
MTILAQMAAGYSFGQMAIGIIVACIIIGIVIIVVKASGITLPWWVWAILGLLALGFLSIFAIRLLMSM